MKGFLRRLRGIIGTGLTWAVGWTGIFGVLSAVGGSPFSVVVQSGLVMGSVGLIAGSLFAVILSVAERRHLLRDLSLRRVGLWGGIGGLLLAGILNLIGGAFYWEFSAMITIFGAACSTGTVALAKRAGKRELLEGDDESLPALEGE